jgi:hypothetical protein
MKNALQWTPYLGCGFDFYEVYRFDVATNSFRFIGSVDTSTTSFVDTTAYCESGYTYKIRAVNICGDGRFDSWSNEATAHPVSLLDQQKVEVVRSTVVDNTYVLTEWKTPALLPHLVMRYTIFRSTDQLNYTFLASVPGFQTSFSDYEADVHSHEYYYKVEIQNACNTPTIPGRVNSSIWLQAIQSNFHNTLKWTHYTDWEKGVDHYVIQKLNASGVWEDLKSVDGTVTEWEEE